ncbi:hypothetical protein R6Q57_021001 [Mikania cordata]
MHLLRQNDDFSEGGDFLIEAAQLTLDIIRQVERSIMSRRARINRDRLGVHARLVDDYFSESPKYPKHLFRRRFRMSRNLFSRVCDDLEQRFYQCFHNRTGRRTRLFNGRFTQKRPRTPNLTGSPPVPGSTGPTGRSGFQNIGFKPMFSELDRTSNRSLYRSDWI